jgi:hypothetical protein
MPFYPFCATSKLSGTATGDDEPIPLAERPEFQSALSAKGGTTRLELAVTFTSPLLERAGPVVMAAYESVGSDEALRLGVIEGERARAHDLTSIAEALKGHGALRPDLSVENATDILLVFISPQAHQILRRVRGRSKSRYRSTVLKALEGAMLRR